jgi:hypothetical protein
MRAIRWLVLSFGLLIQNPGAEGQDLPRPKGPDPKGKNAEPKGIQIQLPGLQLQFAPQAGGGLDGTIDRLINDLEDLRREMKKTKDGAKAQGEPMPGKPGRPTVVPGPDMPPGASHADEKLDRILKQMDEMRRDIKDLQNRLPAPKEKKGPAFEFKLFGPKGAMPKERKPVESPESRDGKAKADAAVQKALQYLQERKREADSDRKKAAENAVLKDQIERLQQEVQKLREKIGKANPIK